MGVLRESEFDAYCLFFRKYLFDFVGIPVSFFLLLGFQCLFIYWIGASSILTIFSIFQIAFFFFSYSFQGAHGDKKA